METFVGHFNYKFFKIVDPIGCSGGLVLYYNNDYHVSVLFESNRLIDIKVIVKGKVVHLTFLY